MKCVFVGSLKEDSGYIVEVLQEKEYEIIQAGEYDQIEKTINPVLESQAEIAVYDLLPVLVKLFCNTLFDKYLLVTSLHWC